MTDAHSPSSTVPRSWRDELVLALRLRDVPGARIGEVLAEVEEYCADSGLDAPTAFGEPGAYAESLTTSADPTRHRVRDDLRDVGRTLLGFVGLMVVLACAATDGPDLVVTAGWLLGLVVVLAASVLTVRTIGRTTTSGWRGLLLPAAVVGAALVAVVALGILLTTPVATVPDVAAVTVGAVLLAADGIIGTVRAQRRPTADVVSAPGADPDDVRRRNVRADILAAWTLPGFALVGVVVLAGLDVLLG